MQSSMGDPVNPWMMETGSFYIWGILALATLVLSLKNRRIPLMGLCLIAGTSAFWQEFFGDWGAYLAWNPAFARLPFWGEMAYTTPVKPLFMPFSWGWWFSISIPLLVSLVAFLGRKFPKISMTIWSFSIASPLFFAYQLYVEGSSVANGWWTYDVVVGPALSSEKGNLPIIFPILIGLWAGLFVAMLARQDEQGLRWHERKMGVVAKTGWAREWMRVWAIIVAFQVTFLIINIIPAISARLIAGGPSVLVP